MKSVVVATRIYAQKIRNYKDRDWKDSYNKLDYPILSDLNDAQNEYRLARAQISRHFTKEKMGIFRELRRVYR